MKSIKERIKDWVWGKPLPTPFWTAELLRIGQAIALDLPPSKVISDKTREKAGSWVTCACGMQTSDVPRLAGSGAPEDKALADFGEQFDRVVTKLYDSVHNKYGVQESTARLTECMAIMHELEIRAQEVAREHLSLLRRRRHFGM